MAKLLRGRRPAVGVGVLSVAALLAAVLTVTAMAATRAQAGATIDTVSGPVSCPVEASRAGSFVLPAVANGTYDNGWIDITNASSASCDWALKSPGGGLV